MPSRPDLAALLVAHKIAAARAVDQAVRGRGDRPLWRVLIDREIADAAQIFGLLRNHAKLPIATEKMLAGAPSPDALVKVISRDDALRLGILPFEITGPRAQVAMIDPTDEVGLREAARNTELKAIKVFVAEEAQLVAAIDRAYSPKARKQVRSTVEPAAQIGLRSDDETAERVERTLVQLCIGLGVALEGEIGRSARSPAQEAARLAREIARELRQERRQIALAGLAAMLVQLDLVTRTRGDVRSVLEIVGAELGWAGGGEDGLVALVRALGAPASGFGRATGGGVLQRIVQAVTDFLSLGGPDSEPIDLENAEQLLRASTVGPTVVDAIMRVLRRDLLERTPAAATPLPEAQEGAEGFTMVRLAELPRSASRPEDRTQRVSILGITTTGPTKDDPSREG